MINDKGVDSKKSLIQKLSNEYLLEDSFTVLLLVIIGSWYVPSISNGAMWGDEAQYAVAAASILSGNPYVNIVHMFAPFGKYIIGAGQLIFGQTSFGSRIGIVILSLFTLAIVYTIPRQLNKPKAGIISVVGISSLPLFATHATSAMLDIPLVFGVTSMSGYVLWESINRGSIWRDVGVGVAFVIVSASKAYGVLYAISPLISYLLLRYNKPEFKKTLIIVSIGVFFSFITIFSPLFCTIPPNYYGSIDQLGTTAFVFDMPIIGGPIYALGSSLYFNLFAGHGESTAPAFRTVFMWLFEGGPLVILGTITSLWIYIEPKYMEIKPKWLPAFLVLPPIIVFPLILPKGFPRFALPVFPVIFLFSSIFLVNLANKTNYRKLLLCILVLLALSPSTAFLLEEKQLSADSQYDDVSKFLTSSESDVKVVAYDGRHELMWYLGDRHTEKYYRYLDSTIERKYKNKRNEVTLIGASASDSLVQIDSNNTDYVVISDLNENLNKADSNANLKQIQTYESYNTDEEGTHRVIIYKTKK